MGFNKMLLIVIIAGNVKKMYKLKDGLYTRIL